MKAITRTLPEIQAAHDTLGYLLDHPELLGRIYPKEQHGLVTSAHNMLCWVLGHPNGEQVAWNLMDIASQLRAFGITLDDVREWGQQINAAPGRRPGEVGRLGAAVAGSGSRARQLLQEHRRVLAHVGAGGVVLQVLARLLLIHLAIAQEDLDAALVVVAHQCGLARPVDHAHDRVLKAVGEQALGVVLFEQRENLQGLHKKIGPPGGGIPPSGPA